MEKYVILPYYNADGKRIGWAIWWAEREIVDVWPTKKQAQEWVSRASDATPE